MFMTLRRVTQLKAATQQLKDALISSIFCFFNSARVAPALAPCPQGLSKRQNLKYIRGYLNRQYKTGKKKSAAKTAHQGTGILDLHRRHDLLACPVNGPNLKHALNKAINAKRLAAC